MLVATISLFVGFGLLGVVIGEEWEHRPRDIDFNAITWSQVPLSVCAVLYSYEGICVILPVESAMAEPKHFGKVFVTSMTFTAVVFASVACLCVLAFGDVTNGSVTAFLVENLQDESVKWWLYMTNTACSVAVLLTYPLQLFPSFELIGPWMTRILRLDIGAHHLVTGGSRRIRSFSPIPASDNPDDRVVGNHDYHDHRSVATPRRNTTSTTTLDSLATYTTPRSHAGGTDTQRQNGTPEADGAPMELNGVGTAQDDEYYEDDINPCSEAFPTPGDSPQLRAILVCFTYVLAIAVPNVQLLVSLAGALSGSATGLIIPPLLELAYIKREEETINSSIITATEEDDDNDDEADDDGGDQDRQPAHMRVHGVSDRRSSAALQWKKVECYILCGLGIVVCVFGTGAALADIARVYLGSGR